MRKIFFALIIAGVFTFSSCKRCYTCTSRFNPTYGYKEFCRGNDIYSKTMYNNAKNGVMTDENSQEVDCK